MYQPAIIALFGLATRCCSRALQGRATTSYDVEIPSTASVVSDWESLYGEVEKYPETVLVSKYGGWVVEVDQTIVLAADDGFIQEITEADVVEEDEEPECEEVEEEDEDGNLVKRCNHSRCFMHATCRSYTGRYVCRIYNPNTGGGHCI